MDKRREDLLSSLRTADRLARELRDDLAKDVDFNKAVIDATQGLLKRVLSLTERAWEIMLQPNLLVALKISLAAGWMDGIAKAEKTGVTAKGLASVYGGDSALIVHLMRLLSASGIVKELGLTTYAPNDMTKLLTMPGVRDGVRHYCDDSAKAMVHMPAYFENNGYHLPTDATNSVFTLAQGAPFFKLLAGQPARQEAYDFCLAASKPAKTRWLDVYPVEKLRATSVDDVLMVDMGGGRGQELLDFHARRLTIGLPGRLVLQDREEILNTVPEG